MRGADEAENDDTEQEPGRVSRKKRAKGGEHLVKIAQSKHAIPLIESSAKGNFIGCLLDFDSSLRYAQIMPQRLLLVGRTYDSGVIVDDCFIPTYP